MTHNVEERLLDAQQAQTSSAPNYSGFGETSVDLGVAFSTVCGDSQGDARIDASGGFEYRPKRISTARFESCSLCKTLYGLELVQICGADIVGSKLSGDNSFTVWHAPLLNPSNPQKRRKLMKTTEYTCSSPANAQDAVHLLRRLNCWWGKSQPPQLLIFINPASGSGRAKVIWTRECLPILEAAGMRMRVVETEGKEHATRVIAEADLSGIDAIGCAGGDGTMSEIVQGLFGRPDWEMAVKIPLCLIPGGTGNGMSASAGLWSPTAAAHALSKGNKRGMDVVSIFQPPNHRYFSFLSLTFGFIANVDIGTEHLRWMGSLRNQIGAALEILKARKHTAKVAMLTSASASGLQGQVKRSSAISTPLLDQLGPLERFQSLSDATLPKGWQLTDIADFSLFAVSIMPHLALDFTLVPTEEVDSGEMTITYLPGDMSQWENLQVMLKADAGKISEVPKLRIERLKAFILEPVSTGTWIVMDGEVLPYERIFAELHPGICSLIVAS